jgi:hypothetical protein
MLVVGIVLLLARARAYVDYSLMRLFLAPSFALVAGLTIAYGGVLLFGASHTDWWTGSVKAVAFGLLYLLVSVALERNQMVEMAIMFKRHFLRLT